MTNKKISLIIPCLNEESGLKLTLPTIPKIVDEVIVVDGDSKDKSVEVAYKYGAKVIINPERGYGLALRTGFNAAKGDIIIAIDGDRTYPVEEIPKLYKYFIKNKIDLLIACRFPLKNRKSMEVKNFFGNLFFSSIVSLLFEYPITDVCSGMWVISQKTWRMLDPRIKSNQWFFSPELKIEAIKDKNIKYDEEWIELSERAGKTKAGNPWVLGLKILFSILRKRFL